MSKNEIAMISRGIHNWNWERVMILFKSPQFAKDQENFNNEFAVVNVMTLFDMHSEVITNALKQSIAFFDKPENKDIDILQYLEQHRYASSC